MTFGRLSSANGATNTSAAANRLAQLIFFFDAPDADRGKRQVVAKGCILRRAEYDDSRRFGAREISEGQQRVFEMMKPLPAVGRGAKHAEKDERSVRWQAEG